MVIDGSTLEKRRDQRAEQLERFLGELGPEDRLGIPGMVNQWTKDEGVQVVPASESVINWNDHRSRPEAGEVQTMTGAHLAKVSAPPLEMGQDLPPVRKRTPEERLNSMVHRLMGATPQTLEPILKDIAGEYWKQGAPVTVDALRAVAAHYLNMTERRVT